MGAKQVLLPRSSPSPSPSPGALATRESHSESRCPKEDAGRRLEPDWQFLQQLLCLLAYQAISCFFCLFLFFKEEKKTHSLGTI